jgi:sulfur-carrier protein adenylyltransferase/sulfurtransferase
MPLSSSESARYSRHLLLKEVGVVGQEKLKAAKVLVIGAGGLGSPSILYLAAAGVGTIGIVDFDKVDVSNLQRQVLFDTSSIGSAKANAAAARLRALNPNININVHRVELKAANIRELFAQYDLVMDGTDRFSTRYLVNDACVILQKPLVSAAIHRFEGQAFTYVPNKGPCYRCLFPEPPAAGAVPNCAEAGVLGVLPGVMGSIQTTEAIKLIIGIGEPLIGRLLTYDALEMRFGEFKFSRRKDCAVCGDQPTISELKDAPDFCSMESLEAIRRLSAKQLQWFLRDAGDSVVLVDVRQPHEFKVSQLPNAVNIPLSEIQTRLHEIPKDRVAVFICRAGGRSNQACTLAVNNGFTQVINLEGGLLAWASEVDAAMELANP